MLLFIDILNAPGKVRFASPRPADSKNKIHEMMKQGECVTRQLKITIIGCLSVGFPFEPLRSVVLIRESCGMFELSSLNLAR
jgi:hypothetical protein